MTTLFIKKLTTIDFAMLDPKHGLLGESWIVDISIEGDLNMEGMIFDFGMVKKQVKSYIDQHYDHKLLVPKNHPWVKIKKRDNQITIDYQYAEANKKLSHQSPFSAVQILDTDMVNQPFVEQTLMAELLELMPKNVKKVNIQLYQEAIKGAYYQYCHGLKKHQGDCQRIAHGHRSKIEIYHQKQRDFDAENYLSKQWQAIYIGTMEDITNQNSKQITFAYQSNQGRFKLTLPVTDCCLMEAESTVENIAVFILTLLAEKYPQKKHQVFAYEGVDKGAFC